ncbi:hypothetical protein RclHR1_09210010 [Rhizophagus clarus]|uniref:Uncharacterized protein n=1 Tax=Rhizophagus clarus TaxID=94130 RepID=A0A2Z6S5Y8_9GLOM|nr:hypothetical protein RclHR1_09210010 [Rhizophagus clarus]GES94199.1 hypothetical protein GLOIN_2v1798535 [Rhizophagus clarus]
MTIKPYILAHDSRKISTILKSIIENNENDTSFIDYPVLIGSRAAKWHVPSFRDPNDWDLVTTISQSISFIEKISTNVTFENIKLVYYPEGGLKIIGKLNELFMHKVKSSIIFDIELISDKMDLRKMKLNEALIYDEIDDDDDNGSYKFDKIEFESVDNTRPRASALMMLELCHNVKDKILFPLLSNFPCIVAPLKILEALKTSHIYWPVDFQKNIADLHLLRDLLNYKNISITRPLRDPQRDELVEFMLKTRINETEIIRGIPGAHINLNMTNEEFLDYKNNLLVQRRIPHDDIHERVKYGDQPIYEGLKEDKSKAWIKKSLFEKIDYQTKLNCVKEEAMTIALERYLIPMTSKNQETSYNLALVKICTTLTKGWFRQFAVDNYPQLLNLDKDLLLIANDIINKYPLKQQKKLPLILDPETQAIFKNILPYTEEISNFDKIKVDYRCTVERSGIKITSPVNDKVSITAIITTMYRPGMDCRQSTDWTASVVILPSEILKVLSDNDESYHHNKSKNYLDRFIDPLDLHPYYYNGYGHKNKFSELTSAHVFVLGLHTRISSDGSWGIEESSEIEEEIDIRAKSADYCANILKIPDLTGDLLFKYVLSYLNPNLQNNGDTPLEERIDKLKVKRVIPTEKPKQHLWYYAWNYILNTGKLTM